MHFENANLTTGWAMGDIKSASEKVVYGIVAFLGIVGNSIVCYVFLRRSSPHSRCSYFIFHLAVADLMACLLALPYHLLPLNVTFHDDNGVVGELVCRVLLSKYPMWVCISVSVNTLIVLTVERYFAVVHPLKYSVIFKRVRSRRLTICCWTLGIAGCGYFLFIYGLSKDGQCVKHTFTPPLKQLVGVCVFLSFFIVPLLTMLGAHLQMIKTLQNQAKTFAKQALENEGPPQIGKTDKGKWQTKKARKIQRLFFVVFLTYTVCWAPNQIIFLIYSVGGTIDFSSWYYHWSVAIVLANSGINPFIYAVGSKRFRNGFTKMFHGCSKRSSQLTKVQFIGSYE
ncbi:kappa-type opioid receptor-like [Asterias amurensis]|uniref:kappa-type opioid receptor-like n=1 Tax=Asterias amurensis TaxID=7602 RepID=UPI003AB88E71